MSKQQKYKYFPIHGIIQKLSSPESVVTPSPTFLPHHENGMRHVRQVHRLLQHLGEGDLRTSKVQDAEEFVCKLYLVENFTKIDEASEKLFNK